MDDDTPFRESVALLLEADGYAVAEHPDGASFLDAIDSDPSGCALVDVSMPGLDGLALQQVLKERGIAIPLVLMTARASVPLAVRAMKAGAVDFVEKPFEHRTLLSAIDMALARTATPDDPELAVFRERLTDLTNREHEVLQGIVAGLPTKLIAFNLGISPRTVDAHRANIAARLHVSGVPNLIRLAIAAGVQRMSSGSTPST
ncbi:response regulator transcription factor [Azospirillum sp.]|uniref:response regulator transcription factor n=1 Tax=Azospirillum sp. TaxID=34012 RepID=UPI003D7548A6